jgi:hypothetical protein
MSQVGSNKQLVKKTFDLLWMQFVLMTEFCVLTLRAVIKLEVKCQVYCRTTISFNIRKIHLPTFDWSLFILKFECCCLFFSFGLVGLSVVGS